MLFLCRPYEAPFSLQLSRPAPSSAHFLPWTSLQFASFVPFFAHALQQMHFIAVGSVVDGDPRVARWLTMISVVDGDPRVARWLTMISVVDDD